MKDLRDPGPVDPRERQLPIHPFADEWKSLKEDPIRSWRSRYAELGFVERVVPTTFCALYVGLLLITVLG